jgi:hypothetical protein
MIDQFIAITRRLILRDGFDGYLPTLLIPGSKHVRVLEGVPGEQNIDAAVASWVNRTTNPGEDFIVAYKIDSSHFKVVSRVEGQTRERICDAY